MGRNGSVGLPESGTVNKARRLKLGSFVLGSGTEKKLFHASST